LGRQMDTLFFNSLALVMIKPLLVVLAFAGLGVMIGRSPSHEGHFGVSEELPPAAHQHESTELAS
jgi:hypothetical protein